MLRRAFGGTRVSVGDIPQAGAFGRESHEMALGEFVELAMEDESKKGRRASERGREIVVTSMPVGDDEPSNALGHGFVLPTGSVLDPGVTALHPRRVLVTLGPRGAGTPMRYSRASVDILVRGSRTLLLQAPSDATYSDLHPADATRSTPWPWAKEALYSCSQEAGDIVYVPDMWARATIHDAPSVAVAVEVETGANEFSIDL